MLKYMNVVLDVIKENDGIITENDISKMLCLDRATVIRALVQIDNADVLLYESPNGCIGCFS